MVWLVFGFVVAVMILAGVLISRLAEIAKSDKGKRSWVWGVLIFVALIVLPLVLLGVMVKLAQFSGVADAFRGFGGE